MNIKNFKATGYTGEVDDQINGFDITGVFGLDGEKKMNRFDGQVRKSGICVFEFVGVYQRRPTDEESKLVFRLNEIVETGLASEALSALTTLQENLTARLNRVYGILCLF